MHNNVLTELVFCFTVHFDSQCYVAIKEFNDPECSGDSGTTESSVTSAVIGGVVSAAVFVLLLILVAIGTILCIRFMCKKKDAYQIREDGVYE